MDFSQSGPKVLFPYPAASGPMMGFLLCLLALHQLENPDMSRDRNICSSQIHWTSHGWKPDYCLAEDELGGAEQTVMMRISFQLWSWMVFNLGLLTTNRWWERLLELSSALEFSSSSFSTKSKGAALKTRIFWGAGLNQLHLIIPPWLDCIREFILDLLSVNS